MTSQNVVKNYEEFVIFTVSKSVSLFIGHSFMDADKRHETLESKTKESLLLKAIAIARE